MSIGFIGFGKISQTIEKGLLLKNIFKSEQIIASINPKDIQSIQTIKVDFSVSLVHFNLVFKCYILISHSGY